MESFACMQLHREKSGKLLHACMQRLMRSCFLLPFYFFFFSLVYFSFSSFMFTSFIYACMDWWMHVWTLNFLYIYATCYYICMLTRGSAVPTPALFSFFFFPSFFSVLPFFLDLNSLIIISSLIANCIILLIWFPIFYFIIFNFKYTIFLSFIYNFI